MSRQERMTKLGADSDKQANNGYSVTVNCSGCRRVSGTWCSVGEGGFERFRPSARIGGGVQWFEWAGGGEGGRVKDGRAWDDDQRRKQQLGMQLGSERATVVRGAEVADGRRRKDHERVSECSWSFGRVARVLGEGRGGGESERGSSESSRERGQDSTGGGEKGGAVCCCDRHKQASKAVRD